MALHDAHDVRRRALQPTFIHRRNDGTAAVAVYFSQVCTHFVTNVPLLLSQFTDMSGEEPIQVKCRVLCEYIDYNVGTNVTNNEEVGIKKVITRPIHLMSHRESSNLL
ncbi:hypothetical protein TcasGA2_TC000448 [Tribolium castaneum]|uniref:Uncharacterized protein n=1 Tax=Tribolium castaneum TaxID=7070 RepID=D6WA78_TRICA|nr:hypothetical protein TcasGA2_TC000448 [Tribolium castaneum]